MMNVHYQTGRGTLCSLDNDATVRTPTSDASAVTCKWCLGMLGKGNWVGGVFTPLPDDEAELLRDYGTEE